MTKAGDGAVSAGALGVRAEASTIEALLARSNALGSDPRVTNFAGGNTSAKVAAVDVVTDEPITLLHVKGSGGDLGTLRATGLAVLVVERIHALLGRYRGEEHEDEMVPLLEHCRYGPGGAAPSIDTAMHGLLPAAHVDHLHPDAVIALAAAADGEELVRQCYGEEVAWVPWRRPGFALGVQLAGLFRDRPGLRGVVLGGHGLTAWAETSESCQSNSLALIAQAEAFLAERGRPEPFGSVVAGYEPLALEERRQQAAELVPLIRGLCSTDRPMIGHFCDTPEILDLLSRQAAPRLVPLGTSCPDHFLRTKVRPLLLDLGPGAPHPAQVERIRQLHSEYRAEYTSYYQRYAHADSPPMRGADPAIVLLPGIGMWSFGEDAQTARVAGEFYLNAVNVMRGAEAVSSYCPIPEDEKFRIEYWALEEAKLARRPRPKALAGKVALITGAASGIGRAVAQRLSAEGAVVVAADIDVGGAEKVAAELGGRDKAVPVAVDVSDEDAVTASLRAACLAYGGVDLVINNAGLSISAPLVETTLADWELQHGVMARGSFLVSRAATRVLVEQGHGGDIVYVVSKNSIVAGPRNVAYGAAKADQAHQVRLLAAELGVHRIRVNGVNPDGVVRGSGIFANGWGDERAAAYGVDPTELGRFYAERTLLKTEILPEHVADAVFALLGGDMAMTTGAFIPVDGGVPAAFLR